MIKYTARVRRGMQILLDQGFEKQITALREWNEKLPRSEQYTAEDFKDLEALLAYMKQETQHQSSIEAGSALAQLAEGTPEPPVTGGEVTTITPADLDMNWPEQKEPAPPE